MKRQTSQNLLTFVTVQPSASYYGHQAMQNHFVVSKPLYHGLMHFNHYAISRGL